MGGGDQVKIIEHLKELRAKADGGTWYQSGSGEIGTNKPPYSIADVNVSARAWESNAALIADAINALPALLEVAEAASILADSVDRWEESVAAIIGRSPETGMVTKPIRDALAKLREVNQQ